MIKPIASIYFLLFGTFMYAQKIKVYERSEEIGGGRNNALVVTIHETSKDYVEKEWKSEMKQYNAKISMKKEVFADDAKIKSISDNTVDVYARASEEKDRQVEFIVGFNLGGAFLSSVDHGAKFKIAEKMVYDFAVKITKKAILEQAKEQEKEYDKLVNKLENLKKAKEQLGDEIVKFKERIVQAEKDIEQNLKDQEKMQQEVAAQKVIVDEVKAKEKDVK